MSRLLTTIALLFAFIGASVSGIAAQGTPEPSGGLLSEHDYPEFVITASEAGFEVPADVQAGAMLLTLENNAPFPTGFSLIQLPEGVSLADLMPPPAEEGATPAGDDAAAEQEFPPALYDSTWAGGAFAMPGGRASSVVFLTEGEWILLGPPDESGGPPAIMTVSGEAEGAIEAPADAVSIELDNFQIRLPEQLPAGPQVWSTTNVGDQPHEIILARTPERISVEDAEALLQMAPDAEPDPNLPNLEEFIDVGFIGPVSGEQTTIVELNLEPGHYIALCFIPDRETGAPHAVLGMVTLFSVGAEGEEVEPPASPEPEDHASH